MEKLNNCPTIEDVQVLEALGPWGTKSGGELTVTFAMPLITVLERYLRYEPEEMNRVPVDIRGLRVYTVRNLPKGRIGGTEWHRIREEMVFAINGSVRWVCEDLFGGKKEFVIDQKAGVWMPPFILHTYEVREEGSELLVIANTLFFPDDPATHDTFSMEMFCNLQNRYYK